MGPSFKVFVEGERNLAAQVSELKRQLASFQQKAEVIQRDVESSS